MIVKCFNFVLAAVVSTVVLTFGTFAMVLWWMFGYGEDG